METKIKKFLSDHPDFDAFDLELFIKKELNKQLEPEEYESVLESLIGKMNLINSLFLNGTIISIDSDLYNISIMEQNVQEKQNTVNDTPTEKQIPVDKKEKPIDIIEIDPSLVLDIDISEFKDMEYDMDFIKSLEVDGE